MMGETWDKSWRGHVENSEDKRGFGGCRLVGESEDRKDSGEVLEDFL